jgi:hypothetical protein
MKDFYSLAQMALPVLTDIPRPRKLDEALIESCKSYGDAIRLCLEHRISRKNEGEIASYLGFKGAHLAKVKYGKGYLSSEQESILQRVCSNTAIKQWAEKCDRDLEKWLTRPEGEVPDHVKALLSQMVQEQIQSMGYVRVA